MPNLLAKLEAEVLVVNPYANTAGVLTFDRQASAARVSELVRASGAQLGAVIDPDGEHVTIVDDAGTVLTDDEALLVLLDPGRPRPTPPPGWPCRWRPAGRPRRSAPKAGAEIVWTKLSAVPPDGGGPHRRRDLRRQPVGRLHLPDFLPAYDAAATLVNLLALLAATGRSSPSWWPALPTGPHRPRGGGTPPGSRRAWSCGPWWSGSGTGDLVLVDGVKVLEDDGWALVLPDPEEPLTHVWAEAPSDARARARAQEYAVRLRQLLR